MTTLVQGARRTLASRSALDERVAGLGDAVEACRGRLHEDDLRPAEELVQRASARLRLSSDHTVVALAGATGSGKSSTFNALAGLDLSSVGVRRPTTSWATACIWGPAGARELLEWLGIPPRHQVVRDSMLDTAGEGRDLQGLVLLDLPDHDSTEVGHHLEVDRLVQLADLMVWVLDPQKYADAAIHDRFLRPLAQHHEVMLVVLNHIDEIATDRRSNVLGDLRRLLELDGLATVPVIAVSARTGEGIDELRATLAGRVADKITTGHRIATDLGQAAERLSSVCGGAPPPGLEPETKDALVEAVIDSTGVRGMVDAVRRSSARRARRATGWPLTSWIGRLRPDPLERLHRELGTGEERRRRPRSHLSRAPGAHPVPRARVESSIRDLADTVSAGLTRPWAAAIRRAALGRSAELGDRLDRAMAASGPGVTRVPGWCRFVQALQWVLLLCAVGGAVWLGVDAVRRRSDPTIPDLPQAFGIALPLCIVIAGAGLGIVLAVLSRPLIRLGASARARHTEFELRAAVGEAIQSLVLTPVEAEIAAYGRAREGLRRARG